MVMEIRMSTPRLHHSSGTTAANPMASATPATTATTRSSPLASRESGVTCTTSIAVSGASSGCGTGEEQGRHEVAGRGRDGDAQRPQHRGAAVST